MYSDDFCQAPPSRKEEEEKWLWGGLLLISRERERETFCPSSARERVITGNLRRDNTHVAADGKGKGKTCSYLVFISVVDDKIKLTYLFFFSCSQ